MRLTFKRVIITVIIVLAALCTFGCCKKKNKYNETYEKYIDNLKSLKEWNYESLNLYFNEDIGDDYFFQGFKGKFDTSEIIKETDEYLIAKVVFEIENPAKTALNVGKNEKYICVTKVRINRGYYDSADQKTHDVKDEYGVVYIENPEEVELKYDEHRDIEDWHDFLKCQATYNRGFGFKNEEDRYMIVADCKENISIDLDKDGKDDTVSFEVNTEEKENGFVFYYLDMIVNKGQDNEAVYALDNFKAPDIKYVENITYKVFDIDENDGLLDIIFYGQYKDSRSRVFRYDGNKIYEFCEVNGLLKITFKDGDYYLSVGVDGIESADSHEKVHYCPVEITDDGFKADWYVFDNPEEMITEGKMELYVEPKEDSEKITIEKGTVIYKKMYKPLNINDLNNKDIWIGCEYEKGKIAYTKYTVIY